MYVYNCLFFFVYIYIYVYVIIYSNKHISPCYALQFWLDHSVPPRHWHRSPWWEFWCPVASAADQL